uniref:Uncharacterized protein n=1 Tax=Oryza sativa subsp. japonica TaxID=39947 RepID=Q53QW4_ORYSJ|nr:hypothetical protein [Oryza sativa Japonica Group]
MTGDKNWFSSLKKASRKDSIIFGDASTSMITATGSVKKIGSKVFNSSGDVVLNVSRYGRVFKDDFERSVSLEITCLVAKFSKDVMFWHRRLGHVGFDHLTRLSGSDLVRGLPKLKKDLDLVCSPCRHAKMVASSRTPIVSVMTDAPGQLLHMDTVGPARCNPLEESGNLDKFESRSTDGLMLGYSAHSRGYRVLVLDTNKIVETCEVIFDEASPGTRPDISEHEISSDVTAPLHIQRLHPPEQIIGNIGECTTRSKVKTRDTHVNSAFVATFEPKMLLMP